MKYIIGLILSCFSMITNAADISVCCNVSGYWSSWENAYGVKIYGNFSGFSIAYYSDQNWDWFINFKIDNYRIPTKEEMKSLKNADRWIEYTGTVEYYVTDKYPTIEDRMRAAGPNLIPAKGSEHRVKRTAKATIKIFPYKKYPQVYNLFFDGVGYAIDLRECKWDKNQ